MSTHDAFGDFLQKKINQEETIKNNLNEEKLKWPKAISALYDQIEEWLKPYREKHQIGVQELQNYDRDRNREPFTNLEVTIGNNKILFIPDSSFYMNTKAIVQVQIKAKSKELKSYEWDKWVILDEVEKAYDVQTGRNAYSGLTNKKEKVKVDLNEETFKKLLQELLS